MKAGLLGSSKLVDKPLQTTPYQPHPVQSYAPVKGQLQENAARQNKLNNGGTIKNARKATNQSGGAFFLEHAKQISTAKSPSVTTSSKNSTPAPTPENTQGVVVVPQFPKNSRTPVSSTAIAEQSIKNQYKQHVQASTDKGAKVNKLGNEQQSGGRRRKRTKKRKSRKPRRTHKKRRRRTR